MKIKKVRVSGFDKLYEGYKACIKENRSGFGDGLFTFLNHMMVSYEIEEFTAIELFYLKKFCSSVKIIDHTYANFVEKKDALDLNQMIGGLLEVHNVIVNDSDIDKTICVPDNILPIGCHQYHVIATFKGAKITAITGSLIQNLFKDENGHFEEIYIGNFPMENKMATQFYNAFYSFISAEMTNIDVITEFSTDKSYYRYANNMCSLAHINSPFGELAFYGNDQTGLSHQIKIIKESIQTSPYNLYDLTYLTFCLRTTFHTFMEFYMSSPYLIDHENLKLTFGVDEIFVDKDILNKYSARINNSFVYLNDFKKGLAQSTNIDLQKFNYIFDGNPITYSIQIPLDDIISGKYKTIKEFEDSNEIRNIYNEISKLSQIALSVFN